MKYSPKTLPRFTDFRWRCIFNVISLWKFSALKLYGRKLLCDTRVSDLRIQIQYTLHYRNIVKLSKNVNNSKYLIYVLLTQGGLEFVISEYIIMWICKVSLLKNKNLFFTFSKLANFSAPRFFLKYLCCV